MNNKYVEEVIQHMFSFDDTRVRVSFVVEATSPDGFNQQTVRMIIDNHQTMRVRDSGFDE